MCLTACGDDKDEPEATYKANGRGLMVNWDGSTEDYFFIISLRLCRKTLITTQPPHSVTVNDAAI